MAREEITREEAKAVIKEENEKLKKHWESINQYLDKHDLQINAFVTREQAPLLIREFLNNPDGNMVQIDMKISYKENEQNKEHI